MRTEPIRVGAAFGAIVVGLSFVGFLHGTMSTHYDGADPLQPAHVPLNSTNVPQAPTYSDMRNRPDSQIGLTHSLKRLETAVPTRLEKVMFKESKTTALTARSLRRAYDGAPPVIPHPISQTNANQCLACHVNGLRFGELRAPALPHKNYTSCTQCHTLGVPDTPWGDRSTGLKKDPRAVENIFSGLQAPNQGKRWTKHAPPIIAHGTFMHEKCVSCHGPNGRDALRSTHPQRQSCLQCHATQARLDQRPGGRGQDTSP